MFLADNNQEPVIGFVKKKSYEYGSNLRSKYLGYKEKQRLISEQQKAIGRKTFEKEQSSMFKKQAIELAKKKQSSYLGDMVPSRKGFVSQLNQIRREVSQKPLQPSQRRFIQRERPRKINWFEHRSAREAYGDDELGGIVDFDSKGRGSSETSSLFGF